MKVIIAGGRNIDPAVAAYHLVSQFAPGTHTVTEFVSGGARGVDYQGEQYAKEQGIPVRVFLADWDKHGKAAGPIRNAEMAAYADALFLIWDGKSRGSASMKREMEKLGKPVVEVVVKDGEFGI